MTQSSSPTSDCAKAGGAPALDVFALRDSVVDEYKRFATSFTTIHAPDIREQVEDIYAGNRYWPEPLIQINPSYKRSTGRRHPGRGQRPRPRLRRHIPRRRRAAVPLQAPAAGDCARRGRRELRGNHRYGIRKVALLLHPHRQPRAGCTAHERRAAHARHRRLPDERARQLPDGRADQVHRPGAGERPITFDRYTGQDDESERRRIADEPPDILLTNFMMLELLMTRQEEIDRRVIGNCADLGFLVLDELHTYRGRQGADVALLVRRSVSGSSPGSSCASAPRQPWRAREPSKTRTAWLRAWLRSFRDPDCRKQRHHRDARAHHRFDRHRRLGKALHRRSHRYRSTVAHLRRGAPGTPAGSVGRDAPRISFSDVDQRWVRARPRTVNEAVAELSDESGRSPAACCRVLRDLLLVSSVPERDRTSGP